MKLLVSALVVLAIWFISGCDYRARELVPGRSTAFDVRDVLGTPTAEWKDADGTQQWEFARGPQGTVTYMAIIGTDNVLKAFQQVLSESWFAKVQPGMDQDALRRLLGRPGETMKFPQRNEEVWSYRFEDGPAQQYHFHVHFDTAGKVTRTSRNRIGEPQ